MRREDWPWWFRIEVEVIGSDVYSISDFTQFTGNCMVILIKKERVRGL